MLEISLTIETLSYWSGPSARLHLFRGLAGQSFPASVLHSFIITDQYMQDASTYLQHSAGFRPFPYWRCLLAVTFGGETFEAFEEHYDKLCYLVVLVPAMLPSLPF